MNKLILAVLVAVSGCVTSPAFSDSADGGYEADSGVDAGSPDAGTDGGCDVTKCGWRAHKGSFTYRCEFECQ